MSQLIVLPDSDEIMRRLIKVNDELNAVRDLYPKIAEKGGRQLTPQGLCLALQLAVYDTYQVGLMANVMSVYIIPVWIDALVDNRKLADAAKAYNREAADAAKKGEGRNILPDPSLEPPIRNERQALAYLKKWIGDHGHSGEILILQGHGKRGKSWEFSVLEPYGMFYVFEDGSVMTITRFWSRNRVSPLTSS